ncbi:unnamed protein product, partial [Iphiclides podalirius]
MQINVTLGLCSHFISTSINSPSRITVGNFPAHDVFIDEWKIKTRAKRSQRGRGRPPRTAVRATDLHHPPPRSRPSERRDGVSRRPRVTSRRALVTAPPPRRRDRGSISGRDGRPTPAWPATRPPRRLGARVFTPPPTAPHSRYTPDRCPRGDLPAPSATCMRYAQGGSNLISTAIAPAKPILVQRTPNAPRKFAKFQLRTRRGGHKSAKCSGRPSLPAAARPPPAAPTPPVPMRGRESSHLHIGLSVTNSNSELTALPKCGTLMSSWKRDALVKWARMFGRS